MYAIRGAVLRVIRTPKAYISVNHIKCERSFLSILCRQFSSSQQNENDFEGNLVNESSDQGCVVKLRGLPRSTKPEEVVHFLRECKIVDEENGVHFKLYRGRPSGEAFVELASEDDVTNALAQDKEHIGNRYIEVFRVNKSEMDKIFKKSETTKSESLADAVVKLRGLPFSCSKEDIAQFFTGLEIVSNGIILQQNRQGRSSGLAFVQFASSQIAEKALGRHKEMIGHRYIEVFKSSMSDVDSVFGGSRASIPLQPKQ